MPALAVAAALRDRGAEVSFLGAAGRAEAELVPAAGYPIDLLRVGGLDRRNPLRAGLAAGRAALAVASARRVLRRRRAEVAMGGGGYVAGPAGLAALSLGIPLVLTEADSRLGLANRLLAPRARRVCLAFPIPGRTGPRYLLTGRPVPRAVLEADRDAARARFGIGAGERCLLVFGGSQGARTVNLAAVEAFAEGPVSGLALPHDRRLIARPDTDGCGNARPDTQVDTPARDFHVLHIAGRRDYPELRGRLEAAGGPPPRYTLLAYEPSLGDALAACDLVLARAGGSIFEIAAAGRPAILVPYPHAAAGHQAANAAWMAEAGAATAIADADLTPATLAATARELLADPPRLEAMATAARAFARPDAADRIAEQVLSAARG